MKTRMITCCVFIILIVFLLADCGPTMGDTVSDYKPQFDKLRSELQTIAASLPEKADELKVTQALSPAPDYNASDYGGIRNTDIIMYPHLLDQELDLKKNDQLDLGLSRYLVKYLNWTGPDAFISDKRASDDWVIGFEQALAIRYLDVARVGLYDPPVGVSGDSFTGGYAEVDGFLIDMGSKEILCSFDISAQPNDTVHYTYKEGEDQIQALEEFAYSTLWENARQAFLQSMNEMCGGSFMLE